MTPNFDDVKIVGPADASAVIVFGRDGQATVHSNLPRANLTTLLRDLADCIAQRHNPVESHQYREWDITPHETRHEWRIPSRDVTWREISTMLMAASARYRELYGVPDDVPLTDDAIQVVIEGGAVVAWFDAPEETA